MYFSTYLKFPWRCSYSIPNSDRFCCISCYYFCRHFCWRWETWLGSLLGTDFWKASHWLQYSRLSHIIQSGLTHCWYAYSLLTRWSYSLPSRASRTCKPLIQSKFLMKCFLNYMYVKVNLLSFMPYFTLSWSNDNCDNCSPGLVSTGRL